MSLEARFKITGPNGVITDIDILDESIVGFPKREIINVIFHPHFPGNPYLERGVAYNLGHPCFGSGSFYIERNDGTVRIISPILFTDENLTRNPFNFFGLKHWNTECWMYNKGEKPQKVKEIPGYEYVHQIGKTNWVEIEASGSTFPSFKYHIDWKSL